LLITKKNKWKVKEKSKRSGLKETIGTNRTAAQSPFFLQILIRLFFLTETLFLFFALSFDSVFFLEPLDKQHTTFNKGGAE